MSDIFGVDLKNSFNFSNGDLEIVSGTNNLAQAIINRLNTDEGFYNSFYTNYGSNIFEIFGMKNNNHSLEYLKIEIEYTVKKDPRVKDLTVTCNKTDSKTVGAELDIITIGSDEIITLNLIITDDLVVKLDTEGVKY